MLGVSKAFAHILVILIFQYFVFTTTEICTFIDSVNITNNVERWDNDSYLYNERFVIPSGLVMNATHILKRMGQPAIGVPLHTRACLCQVQSCINLCCPWGTSYRPQSDECLPTKAGINWPDSTVNVTRVHGKGQVKLVQISEYFALQNFIPCDEMFLLNADSNYYDEWQILEDGNIWRVWPDKVVTREQYCLTPVRKNSEDTTYTLMPAVCELEADLTVAKRLTAYSMLISLPFMMATVMVYLVLPELRNIAGISLVCYLLSLIIGYSLLTYHAFIVLDQLELSCKLIGYFCYYFFMSAFFWLNVISWNVWRGVSAIKPRNVSVLGKRFFFYSLYAWSSPAVFLLLTYLAQEHFQIPDYYRPGIGGGHFCWLDFRTWSAMIYFFGPLLVLSAVNICFFILVAHHIRAVRRGVAQFTSRDAVSSHMSKEKDDFVIFLRLFLIMGVTWSLEIISYIVGTNPSWSKIFYLTDICNALQGLLIFILFAMKADVRKSILQKLCGISERPRSMSFNSTQNTSISTLATTL